MIKDIKSTEQIAEDKIKEAQVKAKDIINKAEDEGEKIIKDAIDKTTKEGKVLVMQAAELAQKEADSRIENSKQENEKLKAAAKDKIDEAVNMVMERIVNIYGDS